MGKKELTFREKIKNIDKRVITLRHSDSSLTSKRASIIISNPKDSVKLARAVRAIRNTGKTSFKLSTKTEEKIKNTMIKQDEKFKKFIILFLVINLILAFPLLFIDKEAVEIFYTTLGVIFTIPISIALSKWFTGL
jgi:hypothetical protein